MAKDKKLLIGAGALLFLYWLSRSGRSGFGSGLLGGGAGGSEEDNYSAWKDRGKILLDPELTGDSGTSGGTLVLPPDQTPTPTQTYYEFYQPALRESRTTVKPEEQLNPFKWTSGFGLENAVTGAGIIGGGAVTYATLKRGLPKIKSFIDDIFKGTGKAAVRTGARTEIKEVAAKRGTSFLDDILLKGRRFWRKIPYKGVLSKGLSVAGLAAAVFSEAEPVAAPAVKGSETQFWQWMAEHAAKTGKPKAAAEAKRRAAKAEGATVYTAPAVKAVKSGKVKGTIHRTKSGKVSGVTIHTGHTLGRGRKARKWSYHISSAGHVAGL
jgi:hypothetical protein